jgi:type VI secretion system secreted protein VgrG
MPYTQDGRLISLTTPLGTDKLLLAGFSGHEAISRLFSFHLDLLSEALDPSTHQPAPPIAFSDIIGKTVTISITQSDNTPRYFNGLVSRFAQSGADSLFTHYQMEVVPWTWMLTRFADCKIFHNMKVGDIIEQVFTDRGFTDYELSLSGTYSPLEYTVQYRETDFNFISRLMEQNGIFYFFQHEEGKHTMYIADSSSAHEPCPGQESAGLNLASGGLDADDSINSWNIEQELKSGKYTLTDYYFITPSTSLLATEPTIDVIGGNSDFELFDYPGEYTTRSDGTNFAELRMQEEEAGHLLAHGSSVCRAFTTGYKFDLEDHYQDSMNTSYVLTEIQHIASVAGGYSSSGGDGGSDTYSNHFTCIPATVPFRPARITPKPFVQGPQTAVVVGKSQDADSQDDQESSSDGEEIWVDKYGRVVVLFHWDRATACSCWVRVSQDWAGQGWGAITIPRVGQEVIVSFLEGDPDRPIITGRVYNASQTVPYPLPANQTRSTFMTRSSEGGSSSTYNELRFEDKMGSEQIFLRGQYDYDTNIQHDSREAIGNNLSLTVAKDQMEKVGGDLHTQVTGGVFGGVGKDVNTAIGGGVVESVGKDVNTAITGAYVESVGKDSNSNITGNLNLKTGEAISINAGTSLIESSGQAFSHNAGTSIDLKGGATVTIEAGTILTLVAGGNSIVISPSGVSIVGTMVMINSGGSASSANCPSPTSPASPSKPQSPTSPDQADDGTKGTKMNS